MSDTLDVLIRARAEVEKGWCQHSAVDDDGNVCAYGALGVVLGRWQRDKTSPAVMAFILESHPARLALDYAVPDDCRRAANGFNDMPSTTKADVLDLFDRAIIAEAVKVTADTAHTFATVS